MVTHCESSYWSTVGRHLMTVVWFNLMSSITCCNQLPLVYTVSVCCCHVYVLVHVGPGPLYVRRILTAYWQDVDYPACRRMRPVWMSGGSHSIEEWWDNQTERQWERGGHMSGQRTMTINCLSQLTWTRNYQDQIIYSTAQKCGTNIHAAHTSASDKVSTSPHSCYISFKTCLLI